MQMTVLQPIDNGPETQIAPAKDHRRDHRAESMRVRRSIRKTLSQAADLKDLAFQTAMEMRESFDGEESAERARAKAQAVTSCIKAFGECTVVIRVERGIPTPGSRRPLPEQPKARKSKPGNKPPSFKPLTPQVVDNQAPPASMP